MDLKTFIKKTLLDIVNGVKEAQATLPEGSVVPYPRQETNIDMVKAGITAVQAIDFQVTVTAEGKEGAEHISVVSALTLDNLEALALPPTRNTSVLRFKVPVCLPNPAN